jgi:hypothetical protein
MKEFLSMFERLSRKSMAATGAGLLAALGVSGVAIAQNSNSAQSNEKPGVESNAPENSAKDGDNVQYTAPGDADAKGASASKTAKATKTVAAGKTSSEAPGTEQSAASEQSGSEAPGKEAPGSEAPGNDGPGGHADEPGNANADHQFQGQE